MENPKTEKQLIEDLISEIEQAAYNHDCMNNFGVMTNYVRDEERERVMKMTLEEAKEWQKDRWKFM